MNIKCEVIRDLRPLYVDGVVSEETRSLIEEHLKDCADCREYLRLLQEDLPQEEEFDFADEAASLKKIKSKMFRNRIMIVVITLAFAVLVGVVIHSAHLAEYTGSIDENLTYELPEGYVPMAPSTDSNIESKSFVRKKESTVETITFYYDGMYDTEQSYVSKYEEPVQIDDSTKVFVEVIDWDTYDNELNYEIFHDNEHYSIEYKCLLPEKGKYYYSSCSKEQQVEMLEFVKSFEYHRPDGSDLNVFQRLYHNLGPGGLIVFVLAVLLFAGIPIAISLVSLSDFGSKDDETPTSSRDLHDSMNRERKAKGEATLPAINNIGGASTNNLARRDHSWSSLPDFIIKLFRRK